MRRTFSIGWDVGAWASKHGDALWILDAACNTVGKPAHGNWGKDIQEARTAGDFIRRLFKRCSDERVTDTDVVILSIDAPLAFPTGFNRLLSGEVAANPMKERIIDHPYLFRLTEKFAAEHREPKRNPLSPLQDQIGSQATKIAHVLAKFGLKNNGMGVWGAEETGGLSIRVIEAYPAMCKKSKAGDLKPGLLKTLYDQVAVKRTPASEDEKDALICALIAHFHSHKPEALHTPSSNPDRFLPEEGWIWFPKG